MYSKTRFLILLFTITCLAACINSPRINSWEENLELGEKYHIEGNARLAIRYLSYSIKQNPENPEAYNYRGLVQSGLLRDSEAIQDFETAISLDSDWSTPYSNLCALHLRNKELAQALRQCNKAINLFYDPVYIRPFGLRGEIYFHLGEYEKSCADIQIVIDVSSTVGYSIEKLLDKPQMANCTIKSK